MTVTSAIPNHASMYKQDYHTSQMRMPVNKQSKHVCTRSARRFDQNTPTHTREIATEITQSKCLPLSYPINNVKPLSAVPPPLQSTDVHVQGSNPGSRPWSSIKGAQRHGAQSDRAMNVSPPFDSPLVHPLWKPQTTSPRFCAKVWPSPRSM